MNEVINENGYAIVNVTVEVPYEDLKNSFAREGKDISTMSFQEVCQEAELFATERISLDTPHSTCEGFDEYSD